MNQLVLALINVHIDEQGAKSTLQISFSLCISTHARPSITPSFWAQNRKTQHIPSLEHMCEAKTLYFPRFDTQIAIISNQVGRDDE